MPDFDPLTMAVLGQQFDSFLDDIDLPRVTEKSVTGEQAKSVKIDAKAMLEQQANKHPNTALAENNNKLDEMKDSKQFTSSQIRFAAARVLSKTKLAEGYRGNNPNVVNLLDKFKANGILPSAGVDILATAIVLPKESFSDRCDCVNHSTGVLAEDFDVPMSAVELRQRVLRPENFFSGVND